MRFFLLIFLIVAVANSALYQNAYSELNAKAKASIRRLADILDQEMIQRRLLAPANSYYQVYPQRVSLEELDDF